MIRHIERWNDWLPGTFYGLTKAQQVAELADYQMTHEDPKKTKKQAKAAKRAELERRREKYMRRAGVA